MITNVPPQTTGPYVPQGVPILEENQTPEMARLLRRYWSTSAGREYFPSVDDLDGDQFDDEADDHEDPR